MSIAFSVLTTSRVAATRRSARQGNRRSRQLHISPSVSSINLA